MKTKLISFAFILFLSAPMLIGQNNENTRTSFALLGGVNLQNLNMKDYTGDKITNDMIIGYHLGVNAQIPIVPQFYFQPGLLFSTKGAKYSNGSTAKLSYIELPLNAVYKALVGSGYFMLGFGPYVGYAVSTSGGDFKSFDAGGNIFAGYELAGGLFFQLNTQLGMLNIYNGSDISDDESSVRNTGFGLSLGYRF